MLITSAVLLFLNIYAPITIRKLTCTAQGSAVKDKARLIVSAFSSYEKLDGETVGPVVQSMSDPHTAPGGCAGGGCAPGASAGCGGWPGRRCP